MQARAGPGSKPIRITKTSVTKCFQFILYRFVVSARTLLPVPVLARGIDTREATESRFTGAVSRRELDHPARRCVSYNLGTPALGKEKQGARRHSTTQDLNRSVFRFLYN